MCFLQCLCHLKLENYHEAIRLATLVLRDDANNLKALYRRAKANMQLGECVCLSLSLSRPFLLFSSFMSTSSARTLHSVDPQTLRTASCASILPLPQSFK